MLTITKIIELNKKDEFKFFTIIDLVPQTNFNIKCNFEIKMITRFEKS